MHTRLPDLVMRLSVVSDGVSGGVVVGVEGLDRGVGGSERMVVC